MPTWYFNRPLPLASAYYLTHRCIHYAVKSVAPRVCRIVKNVAARVCRIVKNVAARVCRIVKNVAARVCRIVKNVAARVCRIVKNVAPRVCRIVKAVAPPLHLVRSVSSKPNCSVLLFAVITYRRGPRSGDWISRQALNFEGLKPNTPRNVCIKENQTAVHTRLQTHMGHSCSQMFYSLGVYFSWLHFFFSVPEMSACM